MSAITRKWKKRERGWKLNRKFQEPDRVPIIMQVGNSFFCKMFGVNIRDFYLDAFGDLDLQIEVQVRGLKWLFEEPGDDRTSCGTQPDIGPIQEAIVFDLPVEYLDDISPWIVRTMSLPEAVEKLKLIPPEENPRVLQVFKQWEKMREKVERYKLRMPVWGGLQIHPPLSAACGFLDPEEVMVYLYDEPQFIHRLFEKLLLAFFMLRDFQDRYFGTKTTSIWLADDHSAFISDEMYRQHVMPYNMLIYARYGTNGRHLHADGPNDHKLSRMVGKALDLTIVICFIYCVLRVIGLKINLFMVSTLSVHSFSLKFLSPSALVFLRW